MIKSIVSFAARLPLAPARLTGRILRQLRGDGASDAQPSSSTPANRASGTRAKARPKRAAAGTRAKARPKRAAAGTRAKAQPQRAARPKPLDDATIARKVESTVFRDLDIAKAEVNVSVDEGVVSLGGEVPTPDLIEELAARATRVDEVRRVENQLRVPEKPASGAGDVPAPQPATGRFEREGLGDRAVAPPDAGKEAPTPAAALRAEELTAAGQGPAASPVGSGSGALESAAGRPDDENSAKEDEEEVGERREDPAYEPSGPEFKGG